MSCWNPSMEWPDCSACGHKMERVEVGHCDFVCHQCPVPFNDTTVDRFVKYVPALG